MADTYLTRRQLQDALDAITHWASRVHISVRQAIYTVKFTTKLSSIDGEIVAIKKRLFSLGFFVDGEVVTEKHGQSWVVKFKLYPVANIEIIHNHIGTHIDVEDNYLRSHFGRYYRIETASLAALPPAEDIAVFDNPNAPYAPCVYYGAVPVDSSYLSPIMISALLVSRYITLGNKTSKL